MNPLMDNVELLRNLNNDLPVGLPEDLTYEEAHARLAEYINQLIKNEFEKLIAILYRIDVSEQKLKILLKQYPQEDAGKIIASLIIERQQQKIKTRQRSGQPENNSNEEEKW
jgi:hypothetical protein